MILDEYRMLRGEKHSLGYNRYVERLDETVKLPKVEINKI